MEVLVIADSRGRGLQDRIKESINNEVTVLTLCGAGSELAAIKSIETVKILKPKLIIITTGICDLTWRDRKTKITKLRHDTIRDCAEGVLEALKAAHDILDTLGDCKISIATLTGLDLTEYNRKDRSQTKHVEYKDHNIENRFRTKDQEMLNEAIIEINKMITVINKKAGVPTTWLGTVIHSYYRKTHHHNYNKLIDGCHPSDDTKLKWVRLIAKSIKHILG